MKIRSKAEFFEKWEAGLLGNKLRTWRDPQDAFRSGVPVVGFRQVGAAGGGKLEIVVRDSILTTACAWQRAGLKYMICESAPDEYGTIQGEICRTYLGLGGMLGLSRGLRMRDAIARGLLKPVTGSQIAVLLNTYMDPSSRDDIEGLLDLYDGATVEFTCYSRNVGFIPRRNTIVWEVRNF